MLSIVSCHLWLKIGEPDILNIDMHVKSINYLFILIILDTKITNIGKIYTKICWKIMLKNFLVIW